ncbi:MAG: DUF1559 domain-containing protein [Planctomycetes bacterium]|nr:DUF1559 domain-containing protein [Planctomycetota bacterium]
MYPESSKPTFRLIELVVVAAVIVILASLLLPSLLRARESTRQVQCSNNLRQLSLGVFNYSSAYKRLPIGTVGHRDLLPEKRFSWYVAVWPFLEGGMSELLVEQTTSWDAPVNREPRIKRIPKGEGKTEVVRLRFIELFSCPSTSKDYRAPGIQSTHYVGIAGIGTDSPRLDVHDANSGIWGYDRQMAIDDIVDGTASTILFMETCVDIGPWLAGGPPTVRGVHPKESPFFGVHGQFGGLHPDCCQTAFADGSVRLLSNSIDPTIFEAMTTFAGGERTGN